MIAFLLFLAACVSALDRPFREYCRVTEMTLDTEYQGHLFGWCGTQAGKPDHVSHVDLNGCLGWGPSKEIEPSKYHENELYPVENGNFTKFCNQCHLIREDESRTDAGHIICNCAPEASDKHLEYMYNLSKIVNVNDEGCLKCGNAFTQCVASTTGVSPFDVASYVAQVSEADGISPRGLNISDCSRDVELALKGLTPRVVPKPWGAIPLKPCDYDKGPGLCCFMPVEGEGMKWLGFHIITSRYYNYRVTYDTDWKTGMFSRLLSVLAFCKYPELPNKCPGGDPEDNAGPTTSICDTHFPGPPCTSNSTSQTTSTTNGVSTVLATLTTNGVSTTIWTLTATATSATVATAASTTSITSMGFVTTLS